MGSISIGGLGSGLDVKSIVEALVNAQRAPKQNSLDRQETTVTFTLTGLTGLSSALDELNSAALDLSLSSNFSQRSVTTSSKDYFTATATSDASPGKYAIEVQQLAIGSRHETAILTGGSSTTFGDGTLTFTVGSESFDIAVGASDTLEEIRNNINNATDNDLVSVNLLNNVSNGVDTGSILSFNSSTTGLGNDLVISFTGDASLTALAPAVATQNATDATIEVDGFTTTSDSNTFTDVIQGATIKVTKENAPGETEDLEVSLNKTQTKSLISAFVETYNAYVEVIQQLGSSNSAQPGTLLGDYTLRQVSSQIRSLFSSRIESVSGSFNSLSSIGISTTQSGALEINNETLDSAIDNNFEDFEDLFAGEDGFATQLRDLVSNYTNSSGIITSREKSLNLQLEKIADDRRSLEVRIEQIQTRLTRQFSVMDAIVAQLNSTQSYLKQQFDNLPGFSKKE